ncbi:hypothetical protein PsYK624_122080 [Phanerochaete sordida]|uniref:Uncharacterized protein n=1 Tax=Phanerochaete sordida TaxID=48140 RepID=A0A9P3GM47_9APHY|nr:hypothetical protein PsYK624_122080 [Phanerochaete sordida]
MSRYVCNAQHGRSRWAYEPGKRDIHPNPPSRRSTHSKPYAGRLTQYDVAIVLRTIFADHPCSTIFLFARTRTSSPRRDGLHLNSGVAIEDFAGFVAAAFSCPNFEATPDPVHTRLERTTTGTWTARSPAPSWFSSETPSVPF